MTFYNSELDIFGSKDTSSLANHFRRRARGLVRMKINTSEKTQMSTLMAQEGMRVPGEAPPQEAANGPASGVIGGENASPAETVADDIPMDVPEGSFIINAAAAEVAGYGDIKTMIMDAIGVARRLGVEISTGDEKVGDEEAVDLLVSKGEVYIEPTLAKIIGYDVLEKINNRGKREVARRQQEAEAQQQPQQEQPAQQAPQPQMTQDGGFVKKKFADGGMSFDDRLKAAADRVTSDTEVQDTPDQIQEEPPEQIAVNQTPRRGAPRSFTRTSGAPIYNYEQHTVHSPATARQAMIDFAPNTHLVSYDVFKDISEQGNDDVVFPLMDLFFSQPGRTDSIFYARPSDYPSGEGSGFIQEHEEEGYLPERGTRARGFYSPNIDKIKLIRDPISQRLEVNLDKLRAEDYKFYGGMVEPYFTRIDDTFTAAHEMIHGALKRESVSPQLSERQEHYLTDYIFPNILLKGKDVLIDQFGEEDYKRALVNKIMSLNVAYNKPPSQKAEERHKELAEEFHNRVIKGNYYTYALKDISIKKLTDRLEEEIKVASRKTNFKKYADEILSQIDFEEVKRITGTPESLKQVKSRRDIIIDDAAENIFDAITNKKNSGGFVPKK